MLISEETRFQNALRTAKILHVAMAISCALFGVVLFATQRTQSAPRPSAEVNAGPLIGIMCMVGLVLVVVASNRIALIKRRAVGLPALQRAMTPMILRLAGAELWALAGFVGSFLRGSAWMPYAALAPVSILVILAVIPRAVTFGMRPNQSPVRYRLF